MCRADPPADSVLPLLTMAVVGKAAAGPTSQWDTEKHIPYSHVAHLGVDSVLFALVSRVGSLGLLTARRKLAVWYLGVIYVV